METHFARGRLAGKVDLACVTANREVERIFRGASRAHAQFSTLWNNLEDW